MTNASPISISVIPRFGELRQCVGGLELSLVARQR
jgi:hypothetical protein